MKQFVILSAEDAGSGEQLSATARAFGASAGWPRPAAIRFLEPGFRELILWGADEADVLDQERREAAVLLGLAAFDEDGERFTAGTLLKRVTASGPQALIGMAVPQAVVLAFGDPAHVIAATDRVGISDVYHYTGVGNAAVGSSSRLLAAIMGCRLDEAAIGAFAALGAFAGTDTPFRGIRRLGAGQCAKLVGRELTVERYCPRTVPRKSPSDPEAVVREGVEAVRAGVAACTAAYPDAWMELSGGMDSRLILAALIAAGHDPTGALTFGEPSHPDVIVAARLAASTGLRQSRLDPSDMALLSPTDALGLVERAGRRRDYAGNAVALGVLDWVEQAAGARPRFSGQNGELARGFYYAFQPSWPRTSDGLARALVRWRLMANERASDELLIPEVRAASEHRATKTISAFLEETGCDWLTSTDMLYLDWRMQRWVGCDWSVAGQSRVILAPLFHSRYLSWALSAPPRLKRGGRLVARVLHALNPELARLPLAGEGAPTAIFDPHVTDRIRKTTQTAYKVTKKVRQRFNNAPTAAPVGAGMLAELALEAMVDERVGLERVAALPFVSGRYVERVAESRQATQATVALLSTLRGLVQDGATATEPGSGHS